MQGYTFDKTDPLRIKRKHNEKSATNEDGDNINGEDLYDIRSKKPRYSSNRNTLEIEGYSSDSSVFSVSDDDQLKKENQNDDAPDHNISESLSSKAHGTSNGIAIMDMEAFERENIVEVPEEDRTKFTNLAGNEEGDNDNDNDVPIEAFNVDYEKENGVFDADGNYLEFSDRKKDELEEQDKWIDDFKNPEKTAKIKQEQMQRSKMKVAEMNKDKKRYLLGDALQKLQYFLTKDDTLLETLSNLNSFKMKHKTEEIEKYIVNVIQFITEMVQQLENKGVDDVYQLTRLKIESLIIDESVTQHDIINNYKNKIWGFKWLKKLMKSMTYTPLMKMQYWKNTYFKNEYVIVKFHDERDVEENWFLIDCVNFM
ncbi:hypothetical protein TPHA_0B04360 [Tetrapisispora phaffii CBS 4417]|uniref:GYF domain-containing protein n=1 Tax=Tetrapisispora phaffii (strain ATCC 24235 / CBS 4417 / NBRC 1672 / NRRL Y-8282 / UCD 70-5) TaxID=1071381 RepID=G8BQ24_TETPH|nr:hypothetical protein TPHA_0B04360 [Tetrapisispora phaffii CBS 4417]CCE62105.1 hypothetical protein TPHA_0B04360 [Tetrapisispora phaffii CBS 4417]